MTIGQRPESLLARVAANSDSPDLQRLEQDDIDLCFYESSRGRSVKILTYNVWFEQREPERLDAVLKVIEESNADILCL